MRIPPLPTMSGQQPGDAHMASDEAMAAALQQELNAADSGAAYMAGAGYGGGGAMGGDVLAEGAVGMGDDDGEAHEVQPQLEVG